MLAGLVPICGWIKKKERVEKVYRVWCVSRRSVGAMPALDKYAMYAIVKATHYNIRAYTKVDTIVLPTTVCLRPHCVVLIVCFASGELVSPLIQWCRSHYSAGMIVCARQQYRHYSGNQPALITPHTATPVNPFCAKRFHRRYNGGKRAL